MLKYLPVGEIFTREYHLFKFKRMPASDNPYKSLRATIPDVPLIVLMNTHLVPLQDMCRCWQGDGMGPTRQQAISRPGLSQILWQVWKKWCNLHLWLSWPLLASNAMGLACYDIQQSNCSLIGIMVYYRPICLFTCPIDITRAVNFSTFGVHGQ